ncbi:hypothetical protein H0X10_00950 [Candidatus Saccharibacteria bacterium]|nr:hypothetical protein [Candidatus Saccharibacteria bacterium]
MENNPTATGQSRELQSSFSSEYIDLSVPGNPEIVDGEYFALRLYNQLPDNKAFAELLGYELERDAEGWNISVPSADKLNELRREKLANTEANTAEFILHEGGKISSQEYLTYIANNKIPIAREYMHHDYLHALGFTRMTKEVFGLMQQASTEALASENEYEIANVTALIDELTGQAALTSFGFESIKIPSEFVRAKFFAGIKKVQIEKRQIASAQQLKSLLPVEAKAA